MSRNFPENATASKPGRPGISTMATCRSCAAEAAASSIETAKHANIRERRMEPPGSSNSTLGCRQQQNCCLINHEATVSGHDFSRAVKALLGLSSRAKREEAGGD